MSMKYIRDHYGVPAYRGARVVFKNKWGSDVTGVISSAKNAHIVVHPEVARSSSTRKRHGYIFHPTEVKYL